MLLLLYLTYPRPNDEFFFVLSASASQVLVSNYFIVIVQRLRISTVPSSGLVYCIAPSPITIKISKEEKKKTK